MALADHQTLTIALTRDDSAKVTTTDRDVAIASAVRRYNQDRPQIKVEDVATTGANTLPLPAAWQEGFSSVRCLEYPIGDAPPSLIPQDRFGMYQPPSGTRIIQLLDALTVGTTMRVTFTARHLVDVSNDTVPEEHREAVCSWAAAQLCEQLAALYANANDSTIQADVVDRSSKGRDYASRAKALRTRYLEELGVDPKRSVAAGVVVNLDMNDSQGRDRLTHGRRFR